MFIKRIAGYLMHAILLALFVGCSQTSSEIAAMVPTGENQVSSSDAVIQGNSFRDLGGPYIMTERCRNIDSDPPLNDWSP